MPRQIRRTRHAPTRAHDAAPAAEARQKQAAHAHEVMPKDVPTADLPSSAHPPLKRIEAFFDIRLPTIRWSPFFPTPHLMAPKFQAGVPPADHAAAPAAAHVARAAMFAAAAAEIIAFAASRLCQRTSRSFHPLNR